MQFKDYSLIKGFWKPCVFSTNSSSSLAVPRRFHGACGVQLQRRPKRSMYVVSAWVLKGVPYAYFGVYVCTIDILGPFGVVDFGAFGSIPNAYTSCSCSHQFVVALVGVLPF